MATALVARQPDVVDGLVLSSPALDLGLPLHSRALVALLMRLLPDATVPNGLPAARLSHDPQVVEAYLKDPLVHARVSARLIRGMTDNAKTVMAAAPLWRTPTLLMFAGEDALVQAEGSRRFACSAPSTVVQAHEFEHLYHEIFNEPDAQAVWACWQSWLNAQWPS